jgi:hypothetical protein
LDADGNFYISYTLNSKGFVKGIKQYMRISQKQIYRQISNLSEKHNSNRQIMEKIRECLDVKNKNIIEIKRIRNKYVELVYEVRTKKKISNDTLINYLFKYPLFSSKHQDFLD